MEAFDRRAGAALYGDDPDAYERGRLQYPERVYEVIADHGVGPCARVVEIGPATGLVTRRLLATGADVTAIEPSRRLADALTAHHGCASLTVVTDRFEDAGLADADFDVVVAATSFHWVEPRRGHERARRALRAGGTLAYWWMLFENPWHHDEFDRESHHVLGGPTAFAEPGSVPFQLDQDLHLERLRRAGFTSGHSEIIESRHLLTADAVVALYATLAIVLQRPPHERRRVLDDLGALVENEFGGAVERTFVTAMYTGKRW